MPETFRVIKPHRPPDPDALTARKGERLSFERRESEWPGWIWCTSDSGKGAWVPENWVRMEGYSCVMKRDYNATELSVDVGEALPPEFDESGWAWVTKEGGESGWVPLDHLGRI